MRRTRGAAGGTRSQLPAEQAATAIPNAAGADTSLVVLLDRADGATRARVVHGLQRERGNAYVQRLLEGLSPRRAVQRSPLTEAASAQAAAERELTQHLDPDRSGTSASAVPKQPKEFVDFYGVRWSKAASHVRAELEELIRRQGFRRASEIVGYVRDEAGVQVRIAGHKGETTIWADILPVAESEFAALTRERDALLGRFEGLGIEVLCRILDQSEQVLIDEQKRYGLVGEHNERSTVKENAETAGLVAAVRELIEKRRLAEAASYEATVTGEGSGVDAVDTMFEPPNEEGAESQPGAAGPPGPSEAEAAAGDSTERTQEYERFRSEAEASYPILTAFADPGSAARLEELASGQEEPLTRVLGGETDSRLLDIRKMRAAANDREVTVWELPDLVGRTKEALALPGDGYAAKLVDERLAEYQGSKSARTFWLSIFVLAVGLIAAIPTGGMSLGATAAVAGAQAAGVGVGLYLASETVHDYRLQSLASTPGLAEKPSTLLLGLDLLLTAFDVPALVRTLRTLEPLVAATARRRVLTDALRTVGAGNPASAGIVRQSIQELGLRETAARAGRTLDELAGIVGASTEAGLMIRRAHVLDVAARLSDRTGLRLMDELPDLGTTPEAVLAELAERHGVTKQLAALERGAGGADQAAVAAGRAAGDQQARILALTPGSPPQAIAAAMLRNEGMGSVLEVAARLSERTGLNVLDEIPIQGRSAWTAAIEVTEWAERRRLTGKLVATLKGSAGGTDEAAMAARAEGRQARILALTPQSDPLAIHDAMLRNEGIDSVLEVARQLSATTGANPLRDMRQGVSAADAAYDLTEWAHRHGRTPELVAAIKAVNPSG